MPSKYLRFDTAMLHDALDTRRQQRGLSWAQLARELDVAAATLTRAAGGGPMAGDNAATFVDWLSLPREAFLRPEGAHPPDFATRLVKVIAAHPEVPGDQARALTARLLELAGAGPGRAHYAMPDRQGVTHVKPSRSPNAFTRIDCLALRRALDQVRDHRGLTWRDIAAEIGQPGLVSASSLAAIGGPAAPRDFARHPLGARIGVQPSMAVVQWLGLPSEAFLSRPPGRAPAPLPAQLLNLVDLSRDLPQPAAERLKSAIVEECSRLGF